MTNTYDFFIEYWGTEELNGKFDSLKEAIDHGKLNYNSNNWHVVDSATDEIVYAHDPSSVLEQTASEELGRFNRISDWVLNRDRAFVEEQNRIAALNRRFRARSLQSPQPIYRRIYDFSGYFFEDGNESNTERINWKTEGF